MKHIGTNEFQGKQPLAYKVKDESSKCGGETGGPGNFIRVNRGTRMKRMRDSELGMSGDQKLWKLMP